MDIRLTVEFIGAEFQEHSFEKRIKVQNRSTETDARKFVTDVFVEFEKSAFFSRYYYADLPRLPKLTNSAGARSISHPRQLFNLHNPAMLWMEIYNTLAEVKLLLSHSRAYKAAEPPETDDDDEISRYARFHTHFEKMHHFNLAVIGLMKVQDLVVRLLFEHFDADLIKVDRKRPGDWEQQLTLGCPTVCMNLLP